MIIRCPQCEHTRRVNESSIPPTAELATCPKCKHRFRFRASDNTAASPFSPSEQGSEQAPDNRPKPRKRLPGLVVDDIPPDPSAKYQRSAQTRALPEEAPVSGPKVQRPQSAFREVAEQNGADIWDAVDELHRRWEKQMEKNVTEVVTPRSQDSPSGSGSPAAPQDMREVSALSAPRTETPPRRIRVSASIPPEDQILEQAFLDAMAPPSPETARGQSPPYRQTFQDENGSRPEQPVDEDMRMPRALSADERPSRDLGVFEDLPPEEPQQEATRNEASSPADLRGYYEDSYSPDPADSAVFWEAPGKLNRLRAFLSTVYAVMFQGPGFFSGLSRTTGPLGPGYLFFLIMGYIAILSSIVWAKAAALLVPDLAPLLSSNLSLPGLLLVAPLALGLMLLFVTGCMRLQLRIVAPEKTEFATAYRITAYAVAPLILGIVPFIGPAVGALWFVFALITGCRYALRLSWGLAVAVPLPPAALLLGGLCWYFL